MKKQTRGGLVTAATVDVRVFFFSFLRWKVLEYEKKKTEKKAHQIVFFKNDFQNEATLVMENEKANTWQACHSRHR